MVSCDALVRSGVPVLPGLTTVPQNEEPDIFACAIDPDGTADGLPGRKRGNALTGNLRGFADLIPYSFHENNQNPINHTRTHITHGYYPAEETQPNLPPTAR